MKNVALIRYDDAGRFVKAINDFCDSHEIIDIKYQSAPVVTTHDKNGVPIETKFIDSALIIYEG